MSETKQKTAVIVVAAGRGTRAGDKKDGPKQYRLLGEKPVLTRTLENLLKVPDVDLILTVIHQDDGQLFTAAAPKDQRVLPPVIGGATRQLSVYAGLEALSQHNPDVVLIHDAARPFVSATLLHNVMSGLQHAEAVLPVTSVIDTIKRSNDGRTVGGTEDRTQLYAAQTPQGFRFKTILAAHKRAIELSDGFTDDAAIAEWAKIPVALAEGSIDNVKLTTAQDFVRAEQFLGGANTMETRVGSGFDIHQFEPGDGVTLGGVSIPHTAKLKGHSDADAGLHVLTDALLGAMADGDIGTHFPPSDMKWRGEPSRTFLKFAINRLGALRGRIVNLDLTIISEEPKIGPHTQVLRQSIADICDISIERVSVKATTSEKMGFVGRGEGLATMATATIEVPRSPN